MGSLTDISIDQIDSIEVNDLSDEHFRDVMEELINHQIPERDKCPLVRRLNASISGYSKSTGDVGFNNTNQITNDNNNPKGNRNGKEKKKKSKDKNLYKTVYTAQDIDGHIGDKSIDDLVYYVNGNKRKIVDPPANLNQGDIVHSSVNNIGSSVQSGSSLTNDNNKLTTNSKITEESGNAVGRVKKRDQSTATATSATTTTTSSSSSSPSLQQHRHQPVIKIKTDPVMTVSSESKIKENHTPTTTVVKSNCFDNTADRIITYSETLQSKKCDTSFSSSTHVDTTANRDLHNDNGLGCSTSDPNTAGEDSSFTPVKSKHPKRRNGVSRNETVNVRTPSTSSRSSNTIFSKSNSSSSTSTTHSSVTSATSNSVVDISMTSRGYESEKEYCADEFRRRKEYLKKNHRKLASSMPHSERNSVENLDNESSCSLHLPGGMPFLPTPPPRPSTSSKNSIYSTPKVSYAEIAANKSIADTSLSVLVTVNNNEDNSISNNVEDTCNNTSSILAGRAEKNLKSLTTSSSLQPNEPCKSDNLSKSSKNQNATTANNNQIKSSSTPSPTTESTISETASSNGNPLMIKDENHLDQEISSKNGKSIDTFSVSSNQMLPGATTIHCQDFDTPRGTKMPIQKDICEDIFSKTTEQDAKMEKTMMMQKSTTSSTTTTISLNTTSTTTPRASTNVEKSCKSTLTDSKTLEALLSPPVEKASTIGVTENIANSRITSIQSDLLSPSSMLKKSKIIPGANIKNKNSCYHRVNLCITKSLSSLPPVLMNDDSNEAHAIESTFTFGFFDDVASSSSKNSSSSSSVKPSPASTKPSSISTTSSSTSNSTSKNSNLAPSQTSSSSSSSSSSSNTITTATIKSTSANNPIKDSQSTSGNGKTTSHYKFMAIKLAEPSINFDVDTNTFNYNEIINFIKTAWESVMCQYRSPEVINSHISPSLPPQTSSNGAS